jgi:hypothetical protein
VRLLSDDKNVCLGAELLHNKRCVPRCIIVTQKPLSPPLVVPFPPNCIVQTVQNLDGGMTSNSLSRRH